MTQNTITLIVLAVLVVFSLPALYRKKKSGDLTLWGKGRNILGQLPSEEAACAAVSSSSRNGSQKDILQFVSSLMKLVRKNHWYIVMPGQLSDGNQSFARAHHAASCHRPEMLWLWRCPYQ